MLEPRYLLTGATGYIGRHIARAISAQGRQFDSVGRRRRVPEPGESYHELDISQPRAVDHAVEQADCVLHFAGCGGTYEGFSRYPEFLSANETTLLNVLDSIRRTKSRARVVFPSSRLVYQGHTGVPLGETSPLDPKTVYAIGKVAGEQYIRSFHRVFGIPFTIVRICLPYGTLFPDAASFGTVSHMISRAKAGKSIDLFGDGRQRRSLVHIHDLTELILCAASAPATENGTFNIGGPDTLSVGEIARAIGDVYGSEVRHVEWPADQLAIESGDTIFDSSRLLAAVNYSYRWNFQSWLRQLVGS